MSASTAAPAKRVAPSEPSKASNRAISRRRKPARIFSAQVFVLCRVRPSRSVQNTYNGDIAQLVERLNGIQEVIGSIPTISTKTPISGALLQEDTRYWGLFFILRTKIYIILHTKVEKGVKLDIKINGYLVSNIPRTRSERLSI